MTDKTYEIGIIGVGHLIQHVLPGLLKGVSSSEVLLSPRGAERSRKLAERYGCHVAESNADVVDTCKTVIVAVRPMQVEEAVSGLPWRKEQRVLSFCAGVPVSVFAGHINGARVIRALPVTAAEFGESPTCIFPDEPAVQVLLNPCGPVLVLRSEDDFEVASVFGAYYGWVQALVGEMAGWAYDAGLDSETARRLVAAMTRGGATTVLQRPETSLPNLVEELCLPGSITGLGLDSLKGEGAFSPWGRAGNKVLEKLQGG